MSPAVNVHAIAWIALIVFFALSAAIAFSLRRPAGSRKPRRGDRPRASGVPGRTADGDVEIYVGNLSYDVTDDMLRSEFAKFGIVRSARVVTHRPSGKSKGYGFVAMPHVQEANLAISKLDGTEIAGRKIRCNVSRGTAARA
ncbi:MAG: hypothetical protein IJ678_07140 [Kiritimatiellae bacterium]|nr:hypothetical protein [Kiritimatiellia bacterium]MBR1836818.1 hypothetical protein [Kiritimatiellia bacterium]